MTPGGEWFSAGQTPPPAGLDDLHWPLYTVGQVAQILGVQPSFLRRLDTQEIVQPARSESGQRRYSRREISRIEQVVGLVGEGFTVPAVRRVLELQAEVTELQRQLAAEQARNETPPDRS
ncbi:MAG: MerR family transcriptional regulator, heat shock protein HspR [Streptosporangiaceae bacterium]|jgi:DNA-binding transcriptional MerR regulator|nr:MerR family transcriptional regulator, heat shock protein HspR [Streptosporangiaceae bacterium]